MLLLPKTSLKGVLLLTSSLVAQAITLPRHHGAGHPARVDDGAPGVREVKYSLPLGIDPIIWNLPEDADLAFLASMRTRPTQIQGLLFYPENFERLHQHPLIMLMPGAHGDCRQIVEVPDFGPYPIDMSIVNDRGECQEGMTPVENQNGFRYLGQALARKGFFVVSVDPLMVQGATVYQGDRPNAKIRARLILRTLETLRHWDASAEASVSQLGVDITDAIAFDHVGLAGHSRGGQAVRYAANILMSPKALARTERYDWNKAVRSTITGVLEVASTDNMINGRNIDIVDIPWMLVAPGCEDDITSFAFNRLAQRQSDGNPAPNYAISVYGANHAYFNSEWHRVQFDTCVGDQDNTWDASAPEVMLNLRSATPVQLVLESQPQQDTLAWAATAFFTAHVGPQANPENAAVLRSSSAVESNSGMPTVSGVEIGHWNLNVASSQILRDMSKINEAHDDIIAVPNVGKPLALLHHAESEWKDFVDNLTEDNNPPNLGREDDDDTRDLVKTPVHEPGVAIPLTLDFTTTTIEIPLDMLTAAQNPSAENKGTCEIHVDVARRSTCYLLVPEEPVEAWAADEEAAAYKQRMKRHLCAQPRILDTILKVGDSESAPLPLKSRFNALYTTYDDQAPEDDLYLIPGFWETLVAPCDVPVDVITIELTPALGSAVGDAAGGNSPINSDIGSDGKVAKKSFLYIGDIRQVYGCGLQGDGREGANGFERRSPGNGSSCGIQ